jgi:hypothetical protein
VYYQRTKTREDRTPDIRKNKKDGKKMIYIFLVLLLPLMVILAACK